jgi:predicted nucleotidyltransferase
MAGNIMSFKEVQEKTISVLKAYPVNKAILFGSYAKNNAAINSDIDLYIDTDGKLRGLDFIGMLENLVNVLGKDVDLVDKTHIEPNSLILKEIENGGIVLYERSNDSEKDS